MDLELKRTIYGQFGIFGMLTDLNSNRIAYTCEHAYLNSDGNFYAKIPVGKWTCIRGSHQLDGMLKPFETFEVTNVPGRTGLLFHSGNYNTDSQGCILLGLELDDKAMPPCVLDSKLAFLKFMQTQIDCNEFELTVTQFSRNSVAQINALQYSCFMRKRHPPIRQINTRVLWKYLQDTGETKLSIAYKAKISYSLIDRLLSDTYDCNLKESTMHLLCQVTGLSIDELFPKVKERA